MLNIVEAIFDSLSARLAQNLLENAEEFHQNRASREHEEQVLQRRSLPPHGSTDVVSVDI